MFAEAARDRGGLKLDVDHLPEAVQLALGLGELDALMAALLAFFAFAGIAGNRPSGTFTGLRMVTNRPGL